MKIVIYERYLQEKTIKFFEKVFKENNRSLKLDGIDSDLTNINQSYLLNGCFWCLLNKNNVCGTIALRSISESFEIRRFFILNAFQNKGYGKKLLNTLFDYAIINKIDMLKVATMNECTKAQHLFNRYGFVKTTSYHLSNADIFYQCTISRELIYKNKIKNLKNSFNASLILNPTENIPYLLNNEETSFFEGLYISERYKDLNDKVVFAGRNEYIDFFEYVRNEWKQELNASDIDLKTLSGLNAHLIFFLCVLRPGEKVMILPEISGGHFATEQILRNIGATVYQTVSDDTNLCIDSKKTIAYITENNIDYLFIDRSEGLYYEDFSWLKNCNCYKIFDASQYLTSILCNEFNSPFEMGFDLIISTLHKNFPGPQKGLLATKENDEVWQRYLSNAKTYISNTHPKGIADSLLPILSKNKLIKYCVTCSRCIMKLEQMLAACNVPVVIRNKSLVPTQHIWILCSNKEESYKYFSKLESIKILTNYRLLPYKLGYGLRIGLNAAVLSGLDEEDIKELSYILCEAYHKEITPKLEKRTRKFIESIKTTAL